MKKLIEILLKKDKLDHLIYGGYFYLQILHVFPMWDTLALIPTLLLALAKEFIWDKWMGKGQFEWLDVVATMTIPITIEIIKFFIR